MPVSSRSLTLATALILGAMSGCRTESCKARPAYADRDGDRAGDRHSSISVCSEPRPSGYVWSSGDCDDRDPSMHLGATEICDGVDNSCDGIIDEGCDPTTTTTTPPLLPAPTWEVTDAWSTFSSPHLADLNGDGVLDIVSGHGTESGATSLDTLGAITAHDGVDGSLLWEVIAREEIFTSAVFVDLGGSPTLDAVLGGRHAELLAIDGETGDVLWQWPEVGDAARQLGWYNFYTPALPGDVDGDGIEDLLVANGGDSLAGPLDPRPAGRLALISGVDGSVIADAPTPDGAETYLSPVLHETGFLFGTGGETWPGALYKAELADLLAGDLSGAIQWVDGGTQGLIAPPVLADFDQDGIDDVVVSTFAGALIAVDGATGAELWRHGPPDSETHAQPCLAELSGDGIPDVFASFSQGTFPLYTGMTHLAVDGATGLQLWSEAHGVYTSSGPVAVDLDGDGLDTVIYGVNDTHPAEPMHWQPWTFDPLGRTRTALAEPFDRGSVSAPWVGDLDSDGLLELVIATTELGPGATWRMARYDLDSPAPTRVTWGAYLGTGGDGRAD